MKFLVRSAVRGGVCNPKTARLASAVFQRARRVRATSLHVVALVLAGALCAAPALGAKPRVKGLMKDDSIPSATVDAGGYRLHAEFFYDAPKHMLRVRYLLHNRSKSAAAIFDRGNTVAVAQGKLKAGSAADMTTESTPDGLVLSHRAAPLRKPAPTVPPIPLAARIDAGAQLGGDVLADIGDAKRVRYCLGAAPFDPAKFSARQQIDGVDLWRASFELAGTQHMLCTPWFVVSDEAFEKRK